MVPSPALVAEYAKSGRSSCKGCGKSIPSGSLRLGLSIKDPRGFNATKWHHVGCFSPQSHPIVAKDIKGFSSLKGPDQDALSMLEAGEKSGPSSAKGGVRDNDGVDGSESDSEELKEKSLKKRKFDSEQEECKEKDIDELKMIGDGNKNDLAVAFSVSDIKNMYKDAKLPPKWKAFQTVIFHEQEDGLHSSEKIAAFDFDGCLANTSVYRVDPDDWSLMHPSIPEKLQSLYDSGYKLVIFTNEANIERWKNKRQVAVNFKIRMLENFMKLVKLPIQVFIACGLPVNKRNLTEDPFRKPKPGMWRLMEQNFNSGIAVDRNQSFYVGDAAGRPNDHSNADIKFAQAIGLKFYVPEEYFGA
ncbi:bifunctional polynucleotide phosphatase/kinase protein [Dioscorea alata]|uniref:Bifunctional polynucleotide phosphatase/kinase protein n=1 Tax=Dioscorea alata TaxID=55571 RepID=A0ACB7W4C7_DIOAL|nr:bifunctional polynucleotide phosphatase/kinase protein [Dioscorea alata]